MKHHKLISVIAIFIFLAVFLTGCWDSVDINEKLIVTTIAFDVKGGEIWYYLEIANIESGKSKDAGENAGKYIVRKGHGKTLTEVRDDLDTHLNEPLYLSGVQALVFTESFAKDYLVEYLYRFRVDETYRKKGLTVITKEDPEELYKNAHENNASVGFLLEGIVKTLDESGKSFRRTTMRLIENLSANYTGILIPCIGLQDKEISLTGYSVINGPTVTGFLPVEESTCTMFLKANKPKFHFIVPYNDINLTIEVLLRNRKITPSYADGKINYDIKMEFMAELMYGDKKTPYNLEDADMREVTEILSAMLKQQISNAIERAQKEFGCDYLQFDDIFRIKFPVEFQDMDWEKEFPQVGTTVDVKVDVSTKWGLDYGANKVK
ncbi:MAG: Ger(x)C family spore germination protein [Oscillospiraceae bacterium]|nr:Ger(x)C family spore germination protein [Oscillospiraceae bacterium]